MFRYHPELRFSYAVAIQNDKAFILKQPPDKHGLNAIAIQEVHSQTNH